MRHSIGAQEMREAFYKGGCKSIKGFAYGTFAAYWDTTINPFTADWSSTSAEVGGFAGASVTNNGNGTATFYIPNVSGTHSFFFHIVPNRQSSSGFMRSIRQAFTWTERIDGGNCGCKK